MEYLLLWSELSDSEMEQERYRYRQISSVAAGRGYMLCHMRFIDNVFVLLDPAYSCQIIVRVCALAVVRSSLDIPGPPVISQKMDVASSAGQHLLSTP
jgi:hypothetical protein